MSDANDGARGVQFAEIDGRRSSQAAGKAVFADAVRAVDEDLARRIESTSDWRKGYIDRVREVVAVGARSPKDALRIAGDGLEALGRHLAFVADGDDASLRGAIDGFDGAPFDTTEIAGGGDRVRALQVPYRNEVLSGDPLLRQLESWRDRGVLEPSCADAIASVVSHPEWLDLSERWFALIGAASEMGPLELLTRWGANVIAVDLPRRHLWDHIVATARAGAGHTFIPIADGSGDITERAGADLLTELPRVAAWVGSFDIPLIVGNYVYADGATFVRVAGAADALIEHLVSTRPDVGIAYLATPTDVFAVPGDVVDDVRARRGSSIGGRVLSKASLGRLYTQTYRQMVDGEDGSRWGLSDALVPIQGANYALAKSVQRWRAVAAREEGTLSSAVVAPATRTRSVTKNRLLAAAYRGAGSFGVEIFEPETCRALTAALLVRDLHDETAAANPAVGLSHPYRLFCDAALHGGMWRMPYEPRSVLPLGVVIGTFKRST